MRPDYLKDVRIADFTWAGAGPFCTKIFSDFGADVLKIESATRPDSVRTAGPFKDGIAGINRSGYFASRNTGKKSLSLDLKNPDAKEIAIEIVKQSDVVANNFGPGVMEKLGFGYEQLKQVKPDIICLSMPTCGSTGPRSNLLGVGMTISALTGILHHTAYAPGDVVGPGTHYPDHAANPYHAAFAVLAALRLRRRNGTGMNIDLAQAESTINFLGAYMVEATTTGEPPQIGNRSRAFAPHNLYRAAGDDQWVATAAYTDSDWQSLCQVMRRSDLAGDATLSTAQGRLAHVERVDAAVSQWAADMPSVQLASTLQQAGLAASVVANSRHLIEQDPQLAARNYFQKVDHPEVGPVMLNSPPFLLDQQRIDLDRPPLIGEHTDEILQSLLGVSKGKLATLKQEGALT